MSSLFLWCGSFF